MGLYKNFQISNTRGGGGVVLEWQNGGSDLSMDSQKAP